MPKKTTPTNACSDLRLTVPSHDDPAVASDIANYVMDRVLNLTDEMQRYATDRFDQAPASAIHAGELGAALAHEVLGWIRRWPL